MRPRDFNELETVFLACRTVGHAWEPVGLFGGTLGRRNVFDATWECDRERRAGIDHPTQRHEVSAAGGKDRGRIIDAPRYAYAEGYLLRAGSGVGRGRARPEARIELLSRLTTTKEVRPYKVRKGRKAATG
jgi:hypothetical protein